MRLLARLAALAACSATLSMGALQGLYAVGPAAGQLARVNQSSGALTPIGAGLAPQGWALPDDGCSPSAIDTTGKWIYVLARNASAPAVAPWWALGVELADGTVRKAYPLPQAYPSSLRACDHALAADGSWHGFITAITRDSQPRLLVTRCTFTWPTSNECDALADMAVLPLGLGMGAATPVSAATNFTLWISLAGGLVGLSLNAQGAPPRVWLLPAKASIVGGLQYDVAGAQRATFFLLQTGAGAVRLARFIDTGIGDLEVALLPGATPSAPLAPNFIALLTDRNALTFLDGAGDLVTVDLEQTRVVERVDAWCSRAKEAPSRQAGQSGRAPGPGGLVCPLLLEYQPFVFSTVKD